MVRRQDFERYLCRNYGCRLVRQTDVSVQRTVGGQTYTATFGNHSRQQIHRGEAQRLLLDLNFTSAQISQILNEFF